MRNKTTRQLGLEKEEVAAAYLKDRGIRIVETNFHTRYGEIDLIGWDGKCVIFIEVKYRRSRAYGGPEGAVTPSKQKKICKSADYFRFQKRMSEDVPIRYDVVAICGEEIHWIPNAFCHHMWRT